MDFTLTKVSPAETQHQVVIDWSQVLLKKQAEERPAIDKLIDWMKEQPHRKDIQVYLGPSRFSPSGRYLQKSLQALGCIVTNRCYQTI